MAFAAYDFLERGDDVIFLECNPGRPAWMWLEMALGITVSEHLARYLLGKEETEAYWSMDTEQIHLKQSSSDKAVFIWVTQNQIQRISSGQP